MSDKVVVVIPVHSETPSEYELISYQQCLKILHNRHLKIIAPEGLNLNAYQKFGSLPEILYIHPVWQSSVAMYNKLKLSKYFYNLFYGFDFLLTYELDAFIFRDDLHYWCGRGYDYIGAPWFEGYEKPVSEKLYAVGNSGFSLRKIRPMKKALDIEFKRIGHDFEKDNILTFRNRLFSLIGVNHAKENSVFQDMHDMKEDWIISRVIDPNYAKFKIASPEDAVKFSFEVNPRMLFQINNSVLPMGCHAWSRYDIQFWKPFIEEYGYILNI